MEMWSFAAQVHDGGVMSSVAVVLALVLQIVSGSLELVPHGLGICQTIIQERQLKALAKNLSAQKGEGFILSPTLRLLREAVCLDGGAFAKRIFRAREHTFTSLGRNLEIAHVGEGPEDLKRASVRTNAVRFLLSCLKYLHSDGRNELLLQKELMSHLTYNIASDRPFLIAETLDTLKTHVLMDEKIARDTKFRAINLKILVRLLPLYNYSNSSEDDSTIDVSEKAHEFLLYVCTTQSAGTLYPAPGLYPKTSEDERLSLSRSTAGEARIDDVWAATLKDGIPVHNFVLSELAQKLRPWHTLKHAELLVAILKAAPELIADYFYNNRTFSFDPKLSMTWIGYAAFLFNTMMIPLPPSFGDRALYAKVPVPTSILLDNILPPAINNRVFNRCLSSDSHLFSFFATRILVLSLEKLSAAIELLEADFRSQSQLWKDAVQNLTNAFQRRIPDMKDLVASYKGVPADHYLHRTLSSRLLKLYYEVIPRVALAANFDVSPFFSNVLQKVTSDTDDGEAKAFGLIELENLVSIASYSPGMRWFARTDKLVHGLALSPFTALLKLSCGSNKDSNRSLPLLRALQTVATENQLVSASDGLQPILQSLNAFQLDCKDGTDIAFLWSYLDNCINRCATSALKYVEVLEAHVVAAKSSPESDSISLLGVALIEQLSFATATASKAEKELLGKFLSLYFDAALLRHPQNAVIHVIYEDARQHLKSNSVKAPKLEKSSELDLLRSITLEDLSPGEAVSHSERWSRKIDAATLRNMLHVQYETDENNAVLIKWHTQSVEDLLEEDWTARLIRLLLSDHTHIRKEALTNLLKMAAKIKESSHEEKDQIWLLLSELAESSAAIVDASPVPSAFASFATHAIDVLRNPLHVLYPKVNTFLTRGPVWGADKIPLAHEVLHGEPSEDDRYYSEIGWFLTYMLDALRTPTDLGVMHRKRWFEKIFALASNPYLRFNLRQRILKIVFRATEIEGGSTTLATRFGAFSWLAAQRKSCDVAEEQSIYDALLQRLWETCDQERVSAWSHGGVKNLIDSI